MTLLKFCLLQDKFDGRFQPEVGLDSFKFLSESQPSIFCALYQSPLTMYKDEWVEEAALKAKQSGDDHSKPSPLPSKSPSEDPVSNSDSTDTENAEDDKLSNSLSKPPPVILNSYTQFPVKVGGNAEVGGTLQHDSIDLDHPVKHKDMGYYESKGDGVPLDPVSTMERRVLVTTPHSIKTLLSTLSVNREEDLLVGGGEESCSTGNLRSSGGYVASTDTDRGDFMASPTPSTECPVMSEDDTHSFWILGNSLDLDHSITTDSKDYVSYTAEESFDISVLDLDISVPDSSDIVQAIVPPFEEGLSPTTDKVVFDFVADHSDSLHYVGSTHDVPSDSTHYVSDQSDFPRYTHDQSESGTPYYIHNQTDTLHRKESAPKVELLDFETITTPGSERVAFEFEMSPSPLETELADGKLMTPFHPRLASSSLDLDEGTPSGNDYATGLSRGEVAVLLDCSSPPLTYDRYSDDSDESGGSTNGYTVTLNSASSTSIFSSPPGSSDPISADSSKDGGGLGDSSTLCEYNEEDFSSHDGVTGEALGPFSPLPLPHYGEFSVADVLLHNLTTLSSTGTSSFSCDTNSSSGYVFTNGAPHLCESQQNLPVNFQPPH